MKYFFLTNINILEPLLDFDINGINIDLHNDFDFVFFEIKNNKVELYFSRILVNEKYQETNAAIIFSNVIDIEMDSDFEEKSKTPTSIVNFAKGDLTKKNKYYGKEDIRFFFIEFENDSKMNIFCNEAIIILW